MTSSLMSLDPGSSSLNDAARILLAFGSMLKTNHVWEKCLYEGDTACFNV